MGLISSKVNTKEKSIHQTDIYHWFFFTDFTLGITKQVGPSRTGPPKTDWPTEKSEPKNTPYSFKGGFGRFGGLLWPFSMLNL